KLALGAQELSLKSAIEIHEENGAWRATETVETPMGAATDTETMEKGTLIVRQRAARQGPAAMDFEFSGGKVTGKVNMGGQERRVNADLGGEIYGDGAAGFHAIGCLPLAEGYSTTLRHFDLQKGKPKLMELKVAGSESVTTPAGQFDA